MSGKWKKRVKGTARQIGKPFRSGGGFDLGIGKDGDNVKIDDNWMLEWQGFRAPCTFVHKDGTRIHGDYGNNDIEISTQQRIKRSQWKNLDLNKPESFRDIGVYLTKEKDRVAGEKRLADEIEQKTGWKKLHAGRGDVAEFWYAFTDDEKFYEIRKPKSLPPEIEIAKVHDPNNEYEKVTLNWNHENIWEVVEKAKRLTLSKKPLIWIAEGNTYPIKDKLKAIGMRWNPDIRAWTSKEKPSIELSGVRFSEKRI